MLRNSNIIISGCLFFSLAGCIESYVPDIPTISASKYVVSGEVTNHEGYQQVRVSTTSPVNNPEQRSVSDCSVEIQDDKGHIFTCSEVESGTYRVWISKENLEKGTAFRVRIITPPGDEILSAYDTMPGSPEIDSVYFIRETKRATTYDDIRPGIQFYVDLNATENDSRFYRWHIDETWEYHAAYPVEYYWDGQISRKVPPDYTNKVCWNNNQIKSIYTLSTKGLVSNTYKKFPLHFADNNNTKLYVGYSILINQFGLTGPAYDYWEKLRINSDEQGGLYEKQPLSVAGNLENVTHPNQKVLGYFGASSLASKRIFVNGIRDMGIQYDSICSPQPLGIFGWREYDPWEFPIYFIYVHNAVRIIDNSCVDCRFFGGYTAKPNFWIW